MRRSARIGCRLAIAVLLTSVGPGWTRGAAAQTASDAPGAQEAAAENSAAKPGIATATLKTTPASKPTAAKKAVTSSATTAGAKKPATSTKKPATAAKPAAAVEGRTSAGRDTLAGPRTLDEINIQGEIPVPQVLFITARDQRRFLDFQHRRYLKNSQRVGETTVLPSWIAVTPGARPQEAPR
jgi:hypothetical protein